MSEMAELLNVPVKTVNMRLFRAGIKPVTKDALYDKSALEAIRNVPGKGRPPKAKAGDTGKPEAAEKTAKTKPAKK